MKKTCISTDWLLRAPGAEAYTPVDLPNDYAVSQPRDPKAPGGASNGFFPGGHASYVKFWKPAADAGHVILDIDGAYMHATVSLNDNLLAAHPHGYTPFLVDLTKTLRPGRTNKLEITTNDIQPSTRWYSGAGLYRDVFLWTGGEVRVEPRDIFVTTPAVSAGLATVRASYEISADLDADATVSATIPGVASATATVRAAKGAKTSVALELVVPSPKLWEPDSPHLYTLQTAISVDGRVTDEAETTFGIRTVSADAKRGLLLNGRPLKLRGGCIHHDHGVLGAAAYPAAELRKASRLKAAGFNALRIAHNPPSLALLEVCDRIGLVVMDEAFDMWSTPKRPCDYHLWFRDWWERDIAYMVERDRNHPCVISYSVGNEIFESSGLSDGAAWARRLADAVRRHDPTRLVTTATFDISCWTDDSIAPPDYLADFAAEHTRRGEDGRDASWADRTAPFYAPMDICGYNYLYWRYEEDARRFPDRVIWGSETHALDFYDSWRETLRLPCVIGDFTWTAYDNLGEAGTGRSCWARDGEINGISLADYPWRTCYQGDFDLAGYRRPQSYFRESVWLPGREPRIFTTHPEHYGEGFTGTRWHWRDVLDTWTFDAAYLGRPVLCEAYTDADEVEWLLNGTPLGKSRPEKGVATFTVAYAPGELEAVAYKGGEKIGASRLRTVGAPAKIIVEPERDGFAADGRDLCYFDVTVADAAGNRIPDAKAPLHCEVEGGTLLGIFSGDPANEDAYTSPGCHAFQGRAVAIVRTREPGRVAVSVSSGALEPGRAAAEAK